MCSTRVWVLEHAGIVDQRRHRTQGGVNPLEQTHDIIFAPDIGLDTHRAPAGTRDFIDDSRSRRLITDIVDAHGISRLRRETGRGRADPAAAARDDHDLAH
jgi:hypothetical protein